MRVCTVQDRNCPQIPVMGVMFVTGHIYYLHFTQQIFHSLKNEVTTDTSDLFILDPDLLPSLFYTAGIAANKKSTLLLHIQYREYNKQSDSVSEFNLSLVLGAVGSLCSARGPRTLTRE